MTIPVIRPYPLPSTAELPGARVAWRLDWSRALLLVHDMQRHFVGFFQPGAEPVTSLVANIARLRAHCTARGVPVVYSAQPADQTPGQRGLLTDFWGPGLRGAEAASVVDELAPGPDDVLMTKWRYSAFHRTELADLLRAHGRDQLVVCGVYAHIGVQATAAEAFMRDVRTFVVADAVADFSRAEHDAALSYMAGRCASVTTVDGVLGDAR
ncbi:isochorismatase family protein [Phytohabitans kaempferiae]|uniref:Isochorismatase family protein n=1 Tax=Phytohabitans kaempferiae TaxID=1620943 RepID=A0ABV6M9K4_9ACTN